MTMQKMIRVTIQGFIPIRPDSYPTDTKSYAEFEMGQYEDNVMGLDDIVSMFSDDTVTVQMTDVENG